MPGFETPEEQFDFMRLDTTRRYMDALDVLTASHEVVKRGVENGTSLITSITRMNEEVLDCTAVSPWLVAELRFGLVSLRVRATYQKSLARVPAITRQFTLEAEGVSLEPSKGAGGKVIPRELGTISHSEGGFTNHQIVVPSGLYRSRKVEPESNQARKFLDQARTVIEGL